MSDLVPRCSPGCLECPLCQLTASQRLQAWCVPTVKRSSFCADAHLQRLPENVVVKLKRPSSQKLHLPWTHNPASSLLVFFLLQAPNRVCHRSRENKKRKKKNDEPTNPNALRLPLSRASVNESCQLLSMSLVNHSCQRLLSTTGVNDMLTPDNSS